MSNIELAVLLFQLDAGNTNNGRQTYVTMVQNFMANVSGEVFILKTSNRATGVPALLSRFALQDYSGKKVALKANFNSADPFPASTHIDTLRAIVETLKNAGANRISLGERSGIGETQEVL